MCIRDRDFLIRQGIALTDSGREVVRQKDNASDKFLEIVRKIDLSDVLRQLPHCVAIATTGQKATDTLLSLVEASQPPVCLLYTSPALSAESQSNTPANTNG